MAEQPNSKGKCKYNPIREEKTSSLQIYDETNSFNDFGGVGGDVIDFYAEYHKISIIEAIENLVKDLNINWPIKLVDKIVLSEKDKDLQSFKEYRSTL